MLKKKINSGSRWEKQFSYSRIVVIGDRAYVSGTVSVDEDGKIIGTGDPAKQTLYILEKIEKYAESAGFSRKDVVRTRMFVTDIHFAEEIGMTHGEFFKGIEPASTMVEVSSLINKNMLIEIEADLEKS
jgi:enamine deaminase RidA (YjgF/YER057c/UK114 family)